MHRTPRIFVPMLGLMFAAEGLVGVLAPEAFRALVIWLQSPPAWPISVVLRALVGFLLLLVALPVRSAFVVRTVGVITLIGAVAGMYQQCPAISAHADLAASRHGAVGSGLRSYMG